jgi:CBS-domain-containing membrane protein
MAQAGYAVGVFDYLLALVFGWFLWTAATSAIVSAKIRSRLPALRARALARRTLTLSHDLPVIEAMRQATEAQAGAIVTLDSAGEVRGVVNEAAAVAIPAERRPWVTLDTVTRGLDPGLTLSADLEGEALLSAMQHRPASEYLLVEADGGIYGVLSTADVDAAFSSAR